MTKTRISLWSGPRNISTALMYSFAQRPDTVVLDEPLYGHYLKVSGAQHPGRFEVLETMELDGELVIRGFCHMDYGKPVLFIKNMAHHLVNIDPMFLDQLQNILLIRNPKEMIPSLIKQISSPTIRDTGLKRQWELYQYLSEQGHHPLVIDSKELLIDPRSILTKMCIETGISYFDEMINWKPGALPEDGVWAKHWYHNVHKSIGFQKYKPKHEPIPESLMDLLKECDYYYQLLYEQALKVTH